MAACCMGPGGGAAGAAWLGRAAQGQLGSGCGVRIAQRRVVESKLRSVQPIRNLSSEFELHAPDSCARDGKKKTAVSDHLDSRLAKDCSPLMHASHMTAIRVRARAPAARFAVSYRPHSQRSGPTHALAHRTLPVPRSRTATGTGTGRSTRPYVLHSSRGPPHRTDGPAPAHVPARAPTVSTSVSRSRRQT